MDLLIFLDEGVAFNGQASSVLTSTEKGSIEILDEHQPFMARAREFLKYKDMNGDSHELMFCDGFVYTDGSKTCAVLRSAE